MKPEADLVAVGELSVGDCFFYSTPKQRLEQQQQLVSLEAQLALEGLPELTSEDRQSFYQASDCGFIVEAVVRESGERCTLSLKDSKYHIWYDGNTIVRLCLNRAAFLDEMERQRLARKKMADQQQKLQKSRSRKKNKKSEIIAA